MAPISEHSFLKVVFADLPLKFKYIRQKPILDGAGRQDLGGIFLFGSRSIAGHILRGIAGFAALYLSLTTLEKAWWASLVLILVALFFWKGCPLCWTLGLVETGIRVFSKRISWNCRAH